MRNIQDMSTLRLTIQNLEVLKKQQAEDLKLQIHETLESLKPANIIRSTFKQVVKSPDMRNGVLKTVLLFLAGKVVPTRSLMQLLIKNAVSLGADEFVRTDNENSPLKMLLNKARGFIGDFLKKKFVMNGNK